MTSQNQVEAHRKHGGSIYASNYLISTCRGECSAVRRVSGRIDQDNVKYDWHGECVRRVRVETVGV